MVRQLRLIALLLVCSFLVNGTAKATAPSYIFVEVPGISLDRGFPQLRDELRALPELGEIDFCEGLGLAIIAVHGDTHQAKQRINSLLHKLRYKYAIKRDADIGAVRTLCERKSHNRPH